MYGDKFTGRGLAYTEKMPVEHDYYKNHFFIGNPSNNINKMKNWKRNCSSSFVRYKSCKTSFSSSFGRDFHGHVNYFFRVYVPQDKYLHGTPFANLVPYKIVVESNVRTIIIRENDAFEKNQFEGKESFFVPITNLYNSVQLVCPFDSSNKPIVFDNRKVKEYYKTHISDIKAQHETDIHKIYLLDLYPHKIKIGYEKSNLTNYNTFEGVDSSDNDSEGEDHNDSEGEDSDGMLF
jgi:hypothetical protein